MVVSRSLETFTPGRGACQPPIPSWTRLSGRHVGDVGGVEPRRRVHAFVEIGLLGVDVTVEMDYPEVAIEVLGHPPDGRVADRVVPAQDDRQGAGRVHVGDGLGNLVEGLFDVAGNGENVAEVTNCD